MPSPSVTPIESNELIETDKSSKSSKTSKSGKAAKPHQDEVPKYSGILLIDKPIHISSFKVCRRLRKILDVKRVGHGGTLDPLATGLLIVLIGRATRLFDQVMCTRKSYSGTIVLGETRTTYDRGGEVTASTPQEDIDKITDDAIEDVRSSFLGEIEQEAPAFSALKHKGKPLYHYARKNIKVQPKRRQVHIYSLDLTRTSSNTLEFHADVSKGTYLRSIANDFGEKLGVHGYLGSLRRESSGSLTVDRALPFDFCQEETHDEIVEHLIPMDKFLEEYENIPKS